MVWKPDPPTLDPEDTPPPAARPSTRPARRYIDPSTQLRLTLTTVVIVLVAILGFVARVAQKYTELEDRLVIQEKLMRVVAPRVGVTTVDLGPQSSLSNQ